MEGKLIVAQHRVEHLGADLVFCFSGRNPTYHQWHDSVRSVRYGWLWQQNQSFVLVPDGDRFVAFDGIGLVNEATLTERRGKPAWTRSGMGWNMHLEQATKRDVFAALGKSDEPR